MGSMWIDHSTPFLPSAGSGRAVQGAPDHDTEIEQTASSRSRRRSADRGGRNRGGQAAVWLLNPAGIGADCHDERSSRPQPAAAAVQSNAEAKAGVGGRLASDGYLHHPTCRAASTSAGLIGENVGLRLKRQAIEQGTWRRRATGPTSRPRWNGVGVGYATVQHRLRSGLHRSAGLGHPHSHNAAMAPPAPANGVPIRPTAPGSIPGRFWRSRINSQQESTLRMRRLVQLQVWWRHRGGGDTQAGAAVLVSSAGTTITISISGFEPNVSFACTGGKAVVSNGAATLTSSPAVTCAALTQVNVTGDSCTVVVGSELNRRCSPPAQAQHRVGRQRRRGDRDQNADTIDTGGQRRPPCAEAGGQHLARDGQRHVDHVPRRVRCCGRRAVARRRQHDPDAVELRFQPPPGRRTWSARCRRRHGR